MIDPAQEMGAMGLKSEGSVTSAKWGEESTVPGGGGAGPKTPRWDGTACLEGLAKSGVIRCKSEGLGVT